MKETLSNHAFDEFVYWSALDYAVGQRVIRDTWKRDHPDLPLPPETQGSYRDFYSENRGWQRYMTLWQTASDPTQPCPTRRLIQEQKRSTRAYLEFRAKQGRVSP